MSGVDYEAAPCPCGCGRPVPAGRRWATTSCGNKARAARRRERCPELRPETPGEEVWKKLTEEQRQGIMNAAAAHAWADWMLINEKEAGERKTFPSRRRPDPRTGKKRPRVYLDAATVEDLERLREGRYQGVSWQEIVYEAVGVLYNREFL